MTRITPSEAGRALRALSNGSAAGGRARAKKMTRAQRRAVARKGGMARAALLRRIEAGQEKLPKHWKKDWLTPVNKK